MRIDTTHADEEREARKALSTTRLIGHEAGTDPGPTLLCIGGLHGNEPAGVIGLRRVFETIVRHKLRLRGEFVAFAGNINALGLRRRFIDRDLNRLWTRRRARALADGGSPQGENVEDREQRELVEALRGAMLEARGSLHCLDLHTTSADGPPFVTYDDTLRIRRFAFAFPVTRVIGLDEALSGTFSDFMIDLGYVSLGFEGGQHDDRASADNCEAAAWIALAALGIVDEGLPEIAASRATLRRAARGYPHVVHVLYRHPVAEGDDFRMGPGFRNFDPVGEGQLMAHDRNGAINSRLSGRVLMPLYQEQGEDGFFIVRKLSPRWLTLSALLRRLRLDAIAYWLPGVRRHPDHPELLIVDRRTARWRALDILHLLGYRKRKSMGRALVVSRREERQPVNSKQ